MPGVRFQNQCLYSGSTQSNHLSPCWPACPSTDPALFFCPTFPLIPQTASTMLLSPISSIWALDSSVLPCLHHSGSWLFWKPRYFLTFLIFHSYWIWPYLATYHWSLMLFPGILLILDENCWWLSLPSTLCSMFPSGSFPMVCPVQSALLPLKTNRYLQGHTVWHHSQCNWIGTRTYCLWIWWERLANEIQGNKQEFLKLSPMSAVPKPIPSGVMRLFKGTINYSRKVLFWASWLLLFLDMLTFHSVIFTWARDLLAHFSARIWNLTLLSASLWNSHS